MQSFQCYSSALLLIIVSATLAVLPADCRQLPASQREVARNSTPCNIEVDTLCPAIQDSDLYSIQLEADSSGDITGSSVYQGINQYLL